MRSFSFIHIIFFLLASLICKCSHAQEYVVTLKNDTLRGSIKPINYGPDKKVVFKDANGKKTTYPITKVRGYAVDGNVYHPVKKDQAYTFMKVIRKGYLSLYGFQVENQTSYDGRFLTKVDGTSLEVPNLGFKKLMTKFLSDCPAVTTRIEKGELRKSEIEQIVETFNVCIDSKTNGIKQSLTTPATSSPSTTTTESTSAWDTLEQKITAQPDFEGKADALEMVTEIKTKGSRKEKIPNFLVEGLKSILSKTVLSSDLDDALKTITP